MRCDADGCQITDELRTHKISVFRYAPVKEDAQDFCDLSKRIFEKLPVSVIAGTDVCNVNGNLVRGRQYPWGVAEGTTLTYIS